MAILINDNTARVQYTATSGQTVFAIPFEFFENGDLKVYRNSTLQTITTHYTLTGAGVTGGGNLTFVSGVTLNDIITIVRDIPIKRVTDFPLSGPFNITALNLQLDQLTAMIQEVNTLVTTRVPLLSEFDQPSAFSALPTQANRANNYFVFDSNGNPAVASSALAVTDFTQAGTGAVLRTAQDKMRETISVADYTNLTSAITAAKVSGRPTVILINGDITVTSTIVVDAPNITLQGAGGDGAHDVGTQGAGARAKLIWAGSAGGTVLQFASPVGAANQKCNGGGATGLYIACGNSAAIGLQVLSWSKGTFENLHFDNPTTVGVDVGVVATLGEARDTQNCYFRNLSSRHLEVTGGAGGLIRLGGDAGANTSLNMFEQLDCQYVNGTAYLFNNSDNNYVVRLRAFRGGGGTGSAVVFNGSNVSAAECARSNIVTHLTTNGALPIICRGTTTFTNPSIDNSLLLLDYDNGYTPPTIETGASATWSDTRGLQARFGYIGVPAGDDTTNTLAAETRLGTATIHVVNGSENHVRLSNAAGTNEWAVSIDGSGNLRILRIAGTGNFNMPATSSYNGGLITLGAADSGGTGFRVLRVPN
jgi:hypothetical protein